MDGMVEENGMGAMDGGGKSAAAATPPQAHSVIQQANSQSVIQQPPAAVVVAPKQQQQLPPPQGVAALVGKPGSVIHTTQQSLQVPPPTLFPRRDVDFVVTTSRRNFESLQIKPEPNAMSTPMKMDSSDESLSDEENAKKRRDMLTRRPSYRKILNDLGGAEIAVIPASALQSDGSLLSMSNSGSGGSAIVQYTGQDGQFYVPVGQGGPIMEDQSRKREMRLLKNREAARECRRKKKEYIKCLENRVAVLENQNKALIDELKALKELYCKQKTE